MPHTLHETTAARADNSWAVPAPRSTFRPLRSFLTFTFVRRSRALRASVQGLRGALRDRARKFAPQPWIKVSSDGS